MMTIAANTVAGIFLNTLTKLTHLDSKVTQQAGNACHPLFYREETEAQRLKNVPEIVEIIDAGASIWFLRLGPPPLHQAEEGSLLQIVHANTQVPDSRTHLGTANGGNAEGIGRVSVCLWR